MSYNHPTRLGAIVGNRWFWIGIKQGEISYIQGIRRAKKDVAY